jgi:putative thioredoxin
VNGQVVAEFVGAQPEPNVREFLNQIAPSPSDLAQAKGQSMLEMGQWTRAEKAFEQVLREQPEKAAAVLGMVKALLAQGKGQQSYQLLKEFPASREYAAAEKLQTLAQAMARMERTQPESDEILEAAYQRALSLVGMGNIPAALDGLMDILRQDKHYRDDEARKVILGLFEILGDDSDLTRQYRSEMASILF